MKKLSKPRAEGQLHFRLELELMQEFQALVEEGGYSKTGVIRKLMKEWIAKQNSIAYVTSK